ncbi:50S ribosomal protein L11 methyltransferase [Sphingorhabdus sp.]|jgi:ribosomal protein L11 methyltransferase|uniref:50S ribosomal protein L11 methyltransferase n=1 Tax=Sphingorhabdus sp. TaxID=1902408 RepID=UPI003BAE4CE6|nr:50S ribosomal protein L11 methyltransferase [Sphingomonadales bacterium]MBK9431939.1 50S ribosomal protein L11 methyltransferase [Sphingomonadales bacterium]MBL0022341.1 50S ribosomal protein L11 methyltransferase [Sphingomonadales bacterium]
MSNWKVTLPCTRQEAEALHEDDEWLSEFALFPTIVADELEAFNDAKWQVQAYFNGEPDVADIVLLQARLPSAHKAKPHIERLPDQDWLTLSQQSIAPVIAGRFYVHTSTNKGRVPVGSKAYLIEAGQAFGTGGHETTSGCLSMLDAMQRRGANFRHIADIGTGTGLLAFAAIHLWPHACATASDIDPVSVDVTVDNAAINGVALGTMPGKLALCVASGTDHPLLRERAPYDLLIANILAGPLTELAPSFAEVVADGGTLILAGLLNTQAETITTAYRRQGFRLAQRVDTGDWPCLRLLKRRRYGWERPLRASGRTSQPPGDFGTW